MEQPALVDAEQPATVVEGGVNAVQITPLAAFLSHASLEAGENQAGEGMDAVQLMTVHAAKGLEFDAVFLTGLEEGLFPHENSVGELAGLEEERRLMYVAITRARKRLYLAWSQTRMLHGQTRYNIKSRFLDELPEGALKWLTPRLQPRSASSYRDGYTPAWQTNRRADYGDTGRADASAERAAQRVDRGVGFRIGQNVSHARFGDGVILNIEGSGTDARAQVKFGREGTKWLALSIAKLEAAN